MMRRPLILLIAGLAVGCNDPNGELGAGGSGGPTEVTIETFNLALAGSFIAYEQERRERLPAAIANSDADIVCLQEVWEQIDKESIRDGAAANFPDSVIFTNDLLTPLNDPEDQNGNIPPPPMTPPCAGAAEDVMNAAIDCVADACNTVAPGDENAQTTSIDCAIANCIDFVAPLLGVSRCYACVGPQFATSTFAEIRESCPTVVEQDLAFQGQNGVMILSRYPLKDKVNWVIPGTWNRRVIMSATAALPGGQELDVYCNHLTPIFDGIAFPYTGQYGDGNPVTPGAAGWEAEQLLQVQKLIDYVEVTSGEAPAVILGDFNAGRDYPAQDIFQDGEAALNLLETAFTPAYTADYVPQCTFCNDNPVREPGAEDLSNWIDHIFLYNLPASSVVETKRTFDEDVVPVPAGTGGAGGGGGSGGGGGAGGTGGAGGAGEMLVPLSDHYGLQSVIRVP